MGQGLGYRTAILRNLSNLSLVPDHNPALSALSYADAARAELRIVIRREQPCAIFRLRSVSRVMGSCTAHYAVCIVLLSIQEHASFPVLPS